MDENLTQLTRKYIHVRQMLVSLFNPKHALPSLLLANKHVITKYIYLQ